MTVDAPAADPSGVLGNNLRAIRRARSLTLNDVATRSGISESWLSQVERGRSVPSIKILYNLASTLGIAVHDLFDPDHSAAIRVVSEAARPRIVWGEGGAYKSLVTTRPDSAVDVFIGYFPPRSSTGAAYTHGDSSEVLLVLEGSVVTTVNHLDYGLATGDSLEYRSSMPHTVRNDLDQAARVLWAVSPPTSGT